MTWEKAIEAIKGFADLIKAAIATLTTFVESWKKPLLKPTEATEAAEEVNG